MPHSKRGAWAEGLSPIDLGARLRRSQGFRCERPERAVKRTNRSNGETRSLPSSGATFRTRTGGFFCTIGDFDGGREYSSGRDLSLQIERRKSRYHTVAWIALVTITPV